MVSHRDEIERLRADNAALREALGDRGRAGCRKCKGSGKICLNPPAEKIESWIVTTYADEKELKFGECPCRKELGL